jgi:hypothetical protein
VPAKLTKGDAVIIQSVVDWGLLTPTEIQVLTGGRNIVSVRRRLQTLSDKPRKRLQYFTQGLGYLRAVEPPEDRFGEMIWYPDQKAYDFAYARGWISNPARAVERKRSNNKLVHDRLVVAYRFALFKKFGARLRATIQHHTLYDRWGEKPDDHILADLFFYVDCADRFPSAFVEVENTAEHHYDDKRRTSARVRKAEGYLEYFERGLFQEKFRYPDFRVHFLIPTPRQAENFAKKLHDAGGGLNSKRFWITDFESALSGEGDIFMTPRDFETRRYSLDQL